MVHMHFAQKFHSLPLSVSNVETLHTAFFIFFTISNVIIGKTLRTTRTLVFLHIVKMFARGS